MNTARIPGIVNASALDKWSKYNLECAIIAINEYGLWDDVLKEDKAWISCMSNHALVKKCGHTGFSMNWVVGNLKLLVKDADEWLRTRNINTKNN